MLPRSHKSGLIPQLGGEFVSFRARTHEADVSCRLLWLLLDHVGKVRKTRGGVAQAFAQVIKIAYLGRLHVAQSSFKSHSGASFYRLVVVLDPDFYATHFKAVG